MGGIAEEAGGAMGKEFMDGFLEKWVMTSGRAMEGNAAQGISLADLSTSVPQRF